MEGVIKSLSSDHKAVYAALQAFNLEELDFVAILDCLATVIKEAVRLKCSQPTVKLILLRWKEIFGAKDYREVIGDIAGMALVDISVVSYLLNLFSVSPSEILSLHISNRAKGAGPIFGLMSERLISASSLLSKDYTLWSKLHSIAEDNKRFDAAGYLSDKMCQAEHPAPYPEWVSILGSETKMHPSIFDVESWKDSKSEVVKGDHIKTLTSIIADAVDIVNEEKEPLSRDDITEIASLAMTTHREPTGASHPYDPDRIFGPVNAIIDEECPTSIKGGCRMLTCICRDFDQGDDDETEDYNPNGWFEGHCDNCFRKIADISHAIRQPVSGGGWIGCFCNVECLQACPARAIDVKSDRLLARMKDIIEKKGIYNRKPPLPQPIKESRTKIKLVEPLSVALPIVAMPSLPVLPSSKEHIMSNTLDFLLPVPEED